MDEIVGSLFGTSAIRQRGIELELMQRLNRQTSHQVALGAMLGDAAAFALVKLSDMIVPGAGPDQPKLSPSAPILIVEHDSGAVLPLSLAVRSAGILNPLVVLPDSATAVLYMDGVGIYSDREKHPLPGLVLLEVTLPHLIGSQAPMWLVQPPPCRQVMVAVTSGGVDSGQFSSAISFGPNALLCKFPSSAAMVAMFQELRRTWIKGEGNEP